MPAWPNVAINLLSMSGLAGGVLTAIYYFFKNNHYKSGLYLLLGAVSGVVWYVMGTIDERYLLLIFLFSFYLWHLIKESRQEGIDPIAFFKFKLHYENLKNKGDFTNTQSCINYFSELLNKNPLYQQFSMYFIGEGFVTSTSDEFWGERIEVFNDKNELSKNLIKSFENLAFWTFFIENDRIFSWKRFPPNIKMLSTVGLSMHKFKNYSSNQIISVDESIKKAYIKAVSKQKYIKSIASTTK